MAKKSLIVYGTMFSLLIGVGTWLAFDLADGRTRIISDRLALALQKSQFMSQWFGTTIVAGDYVLRDVSGKVTFDDLATHIQDPHYLQWLITLLRLKLETVPGAVGLGVYDRNCIYRGAANPKFIGIRSNQKFCVDSTAEPEDKLYVQYVPAEKSVNKQPSLIISRQHFSPDGRFLGGVLIAIALTAAQKWIMEFAVDPDEILAVIDGDNVLLARNPPMPEAIGTRIPTSEVQFNLGQGRFSSSFLAVSPLDGHERIHGLSKIEGIPLVVLVGYDIRRSLAEWCRRAWQISAGFLTLLVACAAALHAHLVVLRQREAMRILATTDPLTGVANRRQLLLAGEQEVSRTQRYGRRMSAFMVDIDHFKSINDTWGHPTGDRVIQALAESMCASTRKVDVVGRLGGEEFAIILPEADPQEACAIAERLRQTVQDTIAVLSDDGQTVRITVSVGVATLGPGDANFHDLLGRADSALYAAKGGGRNQVVAV